jgi:hypothetical protein
MTHPNKVGCGLLHLGSRLAVLKFHASYFVQTMDAMEKMRGLIDDGQRIDGDMVEPTVNIIQALIADLEGLDLPMSIISAKRLIEKVREFAVNHDAVKAKLDELRLRITDELAAVECFSMSKQDAEFWLQNEPLFGADVASKFPNAVEDIAESGKCLAVSRFTASVFHLMRVMEHLLQELGTAFGITLPQEKNWQPLLDECTAKVKGMPAKDQKTIGLAAICGHLYSVKVAWRNEVMHPKATYTEEETTDIFWSCRTFAREFAKVA